MIRWILGVIVFITFIAFRGSVLQEHWQRNMVFQAVAAVGLKENNLNTRLADGVSDRSDRDCRLAWQSGIISRTTSVSDEYNAALLKLLRCGPEYIRIVEIFAPDQLHFAEEAVDKFPDQPEAWFWLAKVLVAENRQSAISAYQKGLSLNESNGLAWCDLGRLYEAEGKIDSAVEAFGNCCVNGDPGSNGCWGAGRMMENQGDIPQAIRYYRMSTWTKARERAQDLDNSVR